ncbi:MAG: hypothetical protein CR986_01885 [Ignavibacteriae bacterium]|nr:MAG: hypothetical protein CR986_01885 [Ignavibacteriota bacterium]
MNTLKINETSQKGITLKNHYNKRKNKKLFSCIHDEKSNTTTIISEINRGTIEIAAEFKEFVKSLLDEKKHNLIIDLENVYFIDSTFYGTLVYILKRVTKANGYMKLVVDFESSPKLLEVNKLDTLFDIYPSLLDALKD